MALVFASGSDELNGDTKIILVDYEPLGDIVSVSLTYKKYGGGFLFGWGAGIEKWDIDHITVGHENKRLVCFI